MVGHDRPANEVKPSGGSAGGALRRAARMYAICTCALDLGLKTTAAPRADRSAAQSPSSRERRDRSWESTCSSAKPPRAAWSSCRRTRASGSVRQRAAKPLTVRGAARRRRSRQEARVTHRMARCPSRRALRISAPGTDAVGSGGIRGCATSTFGRTTASATRIAASLAPARACHAAAVSAWEPL